jgi:sigma-B regulation protein RsbU (phosphoserine phosphatase)
MLGAITDLSLAVGGSEAYPPQPDSGQPGTWCVESGAEDQDESEHAGSDHPGGQNQPDPTAGQRPTLTHCLDYGSPSLPCDQRDRDAKYDEQHANDLAQSFLSEMRQGADDGNASPDEGESGPDIGEVRPAARLSRVRESPQSWVWPHSPNPRVAGMPSDQLAGVLRDLLRQVHMARAEDLPGMLHDVGPRLGITESALYLVDYSQRLLVQLQPEDGLKPEELSIEGTLAGRAYRDVVVHRSTQPSDATVWAPLLDGAERLGVLKAVFGGDPDDEAVDCIRTLASLVAEILMTRATYGDAIERTRRRMPMAVAAELQWNLLPPLTYATPDVVISGMLEPCYDIGGDTFDYAVNGATLHAAMFDAVGHGVQAAQLVTLAMAAYRNARRSGLDIADAATSIDRWISRRYPEAFITGVLLELDTIRGELRSINAGHPEVLVFRGQRHVKSLPGPTRLPFGLGLDDVAPAADVAVEMLERDDRLLLYSDGIIEARDVNGDEFGLDRLVDFIGRQMTSGLPAPETVRRLIHQILEHQKDTLQDDATAILIEWSQDAPRKVDL